MKNENNNGNDLNQEEQFTIFNISKNFDNNNLNANFAPIDESLVQQKHIIENREGNDFFAKINSLGNNESNSEETVISEIRGKDIDLSSIYYLDKNENNPYKNQDCSSIFLGIGTDTYEFCKQFFNLYSFDSETDKLYQFNHNIHNKNLNKLKSIDIDKDSPFISLTDIINLHNPGIEILWNHLKYFKDKNEFINMEKDGKSCLSLYNYLKKKKKKLKKKKN